MTVEKDSNLSCNIEQYNTMSEMNKNLFKKKRTYTLLQLSKHYSPPFGLFPEKKTIKVPPLKEKETPNLQAHFLRLEKAQK